MQQLASLEEQNAIRRAVKDWARSGLKPDLDLAIAGKPPKGRLLAGKYGQGELPAVYLSCGISSLLPRRLEGAPVELWSIVGSIKIPALLGTFSRARGQSNGGGSGGHRFSNLMAATPGAHLTRRKLTDIKPNFDNQRILEYIDARPEDVLRDALYKLPYDRSQVQIEPVGAPLITASRNYQGGGAFTPEHSAGDMIDLVKASVPYVLRDTPRGGHIARVAQGLGQIGEVVETYDSRSIEEWVPPSLTNEQYSHVEVFKLDADGRDVLRVRADIDYAYLDYRPFAHTPYMVAFTDNSAESSTNAQQLSRDLAQQLGAGVYTNTSILPYHPLLEKGDVIRIDEEDDDDDGPFQRVWICELTSVEHPFEISKGIHTLVAYNARLLREIRPYVATPVFSAEDSTGVIPTPLGPTL